MSVGETFSFTNTDVDMLLTSGNELKAIKIIE